MRSQSVFIGLILCVSGCLPGLAQEATPDSGEIRAGSNPQALDQVRVQLKWLHQFQFAGYYAAVERGYYREAGLEVELIEGKPDVDPAQVVLQGDAEFGVGTPEILIDRAEGEPLVVLGVIFQHSPYGFLSLQDSGVSTVSDLAGRRIMIEPQAAELYAYLKREGVPLDSLEILPHAFSEQDLIAGHVDAISAYITTEPYSLRREGLAYSFFSPRASGIDFYGDCFFTTEEQVQNHPQRVRDFYEATLRGWRYAMEHPDEIIDLILREYAPGADPGALEYEVSWMRQLMHPELIPIGYMYEGRWQHILNTYQELGMIDGPVNLNVFLYDPNPVRDMTWLYWVTGITLAACALAFAILLPVWRLNLRLRAELAQRIQAQNELERAIDRAETANREKARFLAMVSHEIRTPMNGIIGFTSLLHRTPLSQEQTEQLQLISNSAQSLLSLVNDLLDFSKIESGRVELEEIDFSPGDLAQETAAFFRPQAERKSIQLHFEKADDLPGLVRGDPSRLRQILFNLLGNAIKFTEEGSVTFRVQRNGEGNGLRFEVEDTGPGIPSDRLERIFEPFAQADSSVYRTHGGTGLGLPICRLLTTRMGGDLRFHSPPGQGLKVDLSLPMLAAESPGDVDAAGPSKEIETPDSGQWAADLKDRRILIAEDDPVGARLILALLQSRGLAAEWVEDGAQAAQTWERERQEILFVDLHLPELDGVEVIRRVRNAESDGSSRTLIVVVTASAASADRASGLEAGADEVLTKPISLTALEAVLKSAASSKIPPSQA